MLDINILLIALLFISDDAALALPFGSRTSFFEGPIVSTFFQRRKDPDKFHTLIMKKAAVCPFKI